MLFPLYQRAKDERRRPPGIAPNRTAIVTGTAPSPRLGTPIHYCDPFALEVHRAIDARDLGMTLPELPDYVPRAHDARLREIVGEAKAGQRRLVTLVGGSSTGKTRACWEAIQGLRDAPEEWRVWHPYDPSRPSAAAEAINRVGPYTVVWLNEAQLYLNTADSGVGECVAAGLRTLLADPRRWPVLVMATLWPEHWATLTTQPRSDRPAPHPQARDLSMHTDIDVPESFTNTDLAGPPSGNPPNLA